VGEGCQAEIFPITADALYKMKVIHTVPGLAPALGGPARSVPALCAEIAALGNEVILVYLDFGDKFGEPNLIQHPNLTYKRMKVQIRVGMRPIWIPGFRSALLELGTEAPELIFHDHGVWLPYSGQVLKAAEKLDAKVITATRGMLEPWALRFKQARKMAAWSIYQKSRLNRNTVLQATSDLEAENLSKLDLKPPIAVIPNGTILPDYAAGRGRNDGDERILLFLSRIHPKKGLLNLVEAIREIKPQDWKVMVAGYDEGGYQAVVERAVREYALEEYFDFIGPIRDDQKWELYRRADVFVLPSFSENFGLVVAEALAAGTPVVTTRGTPWGDLLDYNCGWWIDPTQQALTSCLRDVFAMAPADLRDMGAEGRRLVEEKYSWPAVARQLNEVYSWMLGKMDKIPRTLITR
jgi:glycosyltransferase involved in cell wall biosynthesis